MKRLWTWFTGLPFRLLEGWGALRRRTQIIVGATAFVLVGAASVAGYKGYEHMEHDNSFCLSCHLMTDAYQRFARSGHSKIECHDCHKSTRIEQAEQLWAVIARNPTRVEKHADVPNRVCEACHASGDSVRWRQVRETAGHRVHLMSKDSSLRGLQCIVCHGGTDLHAFASVDQTCLKAGCHANNTIRLGKMGNLSIYCATCHNFMVRSTAIEVDSLGRALTPQAQQCLSCHEMRQRLGNLEITADPHRGVCGDCHNPHTQTNAAGAIKSCTAAGCHERAQMDTVAFHRGVEITGRCATCHKPHSFRVDGSDCLRCHQNVRRERASPHPIASASPWGHEAPLLRERAAKPAAPPAQQPQEPAPVPRMSHGDHRNLRCAACHNSRVRHGQLLVRSIADCRNCHHVGEASTSCARCHTTLTTPNTVQVAFTAPGRAQPDRRPVRFMHTVHDSITCTRCHDDTPDRAPTKADCAGCHTQHHTPVNADCLTCHRGANALADHKLADHTTCTTAACHGTRAANLPDTRAACLVCHQQQTQHRPGRNCNACHQVRST